MGFSAKAIPHNLWGCLNACLAVSRHVIELPRSKPPVWPMKLFFWGSEHAFIQGLEQQSNVAMEVAKAAPAKKRALGREFVHKIWPPQKIWRS